MRGYKRAIIEKKKRVESEKTELMCIVVYKSIKKRPERKVLILWVIGVRRNVILT